MIQPLVISIPEAMKLTGLSRPSIAALIRDGSIKAVTVGTRIKVSRQSVHEWANDSTSAPAMAGNDNAIGHA